jgi:4-amino-4-deoxy-L-arabinose transferase-like glycosyltransferase
MPIGPLHTHNHRHIHRVRGLLIILILLTAGLRLADLPVLPPGLWYDEAYNAMDALWMLESGDPQVFFWGNNGREPMLHFLGALSMAILGATPYAFRLVSAMAAVLTVPLLFRWMVSLFQNDSDRHWVALLAATGLAFSFWYLVMSRTGHRTVLFPFFTILTSYLFWRSWREGSIFLAAAAGVALGISQYTYILARLLPFVFITFAASWTLLNTGQLRQLRARVEVEKEPSIYRLPHLWTTLAIMGIVSAFFFLPLGIFFIDHPNAFFARTGDVFILEHLKSGEITLFGQFLAALQVFFGGSDPNWRHNIVGTPGFDMLSTAAFVIGLAVCVKRIRQSSYLFLLVSLFVMWLPSLTSTPAVYTLRLSGLLPAYYAIMAVGLGSVAKWITQQFSSRIGAASMHITILFLIFTISGGLTVHRYFIRWANTPMVYSQYNGPLADLADHIKSKSYDTDILLPLPVYMHPTMHFLLHRQFPERDEPFSATATRQTILFDVDDIYLIPNMVNINASSSYVWLTRTGAGKASVIHLQKPDDINDLYLSDEQTFFSSPRTSEIIARVLPVKGIDAFLPKMAGPSDTHVVDLCWDQQVCLVGYQVLPDIVRVGETPVLNLYWRGLTSQPSEYKTFIHLIDSNGQPVAQFDGVTLSEEQRWRQGMLSPEQHLLPLGPQATPGGYLVRLGLIDPDTNLRLPVTGQNGQPLGDYVQIGLFYLTNQQSDFRQPLNISSVKLGNRINLLGYSIQQSKSDQSTGETVTVKLHWQADSDIAEDYTIFVHLLDDDDRWVAGHDSPPLAGLYPTFQWQPQEIVVTELSLSLPSDFLDGDYSLVTGMYNPADGQRLTALDENGNRLESDVVPLGRISVNPDP